MSEGQRQRTNTYLTDLGKDELHSPDLTLAAETELSANAELLVQTLALIGATGGAGSQTVYFMKTILIRNEVGENEICDTNADMIYFIRIQFTYSFCGGHK